MRRSLLLPAALLILAMGVASASAASDPMAFALDQQPSAAFAGAASVAGRAAIGDRPRAAQHREAVQTFREDLTRAMRNVALLGIASLIFGLGAAGAKALWILDDAESTSHGWPRWFSP